MPDPNQDTNQIPIIKLEDPKSQRKLVLVIVAASVLLLDNMLSMVIVPIIPDYLRETGAWEIITIQGTFAFSEVRPPIIVNRVNAYEGENIAIGFLFASKAVVQLFIRLTIMFLSTAIFSIATSYAVLFFARTLQCVGSAFADTSVFAMIASVYKEQGERTRAIGIVLAFISIGCLVAPTFGGLLYELYGKEVPFLILSVVLLLDGCLLWIVMKPVEKQEKGSGVQKPTPICTVFMDPYIACWSGALITANVSLAFLEPTVSIWMMDKMKSRQLEQGMIWLPMLIPHITAIVVAVLLSKKYPQHHYSLAAAGLSLEGVCCLKILFSKSSWELKVLLSGVCFGIALINTALLPTLGYLVDSRHVSVYYGSISAIADISYIFAYAFGRILAGKVLENIGFTALNVGIAVVTLAYVPILTKKGCEPVRPYETTNK